MAAPASEERPLLLLLPGPAAVADALRAVLADAQARAYALPAVWDLSWGPLDAIAALPDVRRLDLENLPKVVAWLLRAATPATLEEILATGWAALPDRVREWYLRRSPLAVVASALRLGRPARSFEPPAAYRRDRVLSMRLEASYRLPRAEGPRDPAAPPEEASVVFYPFVPAGALAREEAGEAAAGAGAALEVFAYAAGRSRHLRHLASIASAHGWRAIDPSPEGGAAP